MIAIIIIFASISIILVLRLFKKKNNHKENEKQNIDAYEIYANWCKMKNEIPITREKFDQLANEQGSINISDLMSKHKSNLQNDLEKTNINASANDYYEKLKKEAEERKKRDEKFLTSTIAGYVTNSTTKGTLIGGNLSGGALGNYLNKKKKK